MKSDTRPNVQFSGHFHRFNYILEDFSHMVALPAFQDETEFFVRLGYGRQMGFCIADYEIADQTIKRFKVELFPRL